MYVYVMGAENFADMIQVISGVERLNTEARARRYAHGRRS